MRRLEQAGSRGVLTSSAEVVLTLTAPDRFLNTYISRQPICLQKNLFFEACSHLPKENMSFTKKNPENLTLTDRSALLSYSPLLLPEPSTGIVWGASPVTHMLY